MQVIIEIITHPIFIAVFTSWFCAQSLKIMIWLIKNKNLNLRLFTDTGGMPSSHTAFTVSLATAIFYSAGISTQFYLSLGLALIVIRDALGIRAVVGNISQVLNQTLLSEQKYKKYNNLYRLKENTGHTLIQVFIGAIIGVIIPVIFFTYLF